jgi:hypothetical protein
VAIKIPTYDKEKKLAARDEARRLRDAAERTKTERKAG